MSRFQRAIHGLASGYAVLAAAAIYSLASVPLALGFLSTERFALWTLLSTVSGYLALIDFGMSGAIARLLVDQKDDRHGSSYGSLVKTGWAVSIAQGALIFIAGFVMAPVLSVALDINSELKNTFIQLLRLQSAVLAYGFLPRIFAHILQAHQRLDIVNYSQIAVVVINFAGLWFFLRSGQDVFSMIWASFVATTVGSLIVCIASWYLKLLPSRGKWGTVTWVQFKEIFTYGRDVFLVAVGAQLIMSSQAMIITRTLGLEVAAVWAIGTKMFNLLSQIIWRIFDTSAPALSEMISKGEESTLRQRYKTILVLTASSSAFAAVCYILCNSLFVYLWTNGRISWPVSNDLLLAVWMVVLAILHCHNGFVLLTKKIAMMRYIYFVEGIVFIVLALVSAESFGLKGIILSSIACSLLFSSIYGVYRVSNFFSYSARYVGLQWLAPMGRFLTCFAPIAAVVWWSGRVWNDTPRLALYVVFCCSVGTILFLRFGLSHPFRVELLNRAPKTLTPVLKRLLNVN